MNFAAVPISRHHDHALDRRLLAVSIGLIASVDVHCVFPPVVGAAPSRRHYAERAQPPSRHKTPRIPNLLVILLGENRDLPARYSAQFHQVRTDVGFLSSSA